MKNGNRRKAFDPLSSFPKPTHTVRNITLTDIYGTFGSFGTSRPLPRDTIENIVLENFDVKPTKPALHSPA